MKALHAWTVHCVHSSHSAWCTARGGKTQRLIAWPILGSLPEDTSLRRLFTADNHCACSTHLHPTFSEWPTQPARMHRRLHVWMTSGRTRMLFHVV